MIVADFRDNKEEGTITFITNELDTNVSAADICETYRQRWQIETLFYDKYFLMRSKESPCFICAYNSNSYIATSHKDLS